MRRRRVFGNEVLANPVILAVTPNPMVDALMVAHSAPRQARAGPRRPTALRSHPQYPSSGTDLTMRAQVGENQKQARFHALCQALRPDLLRFAVWLSRDRTIAEDVVQETLLRAWKAQDSLQDEKAAKSWLL